MNTPTKFIFLSLFISSMYCQSEASIALESSLIPLQFTTANKASLHLGVVQRQNDVRFINGLQFQPTKNLLIGGVLSPHKIETNLSIYYHLVIGYIPKWKFLNISSTMFQIGMHRNRFEAAKDARWYSFSIMESARFGRLNLNLCWNHLFSQVWDRDTALISTELKLSNSIHLRPGAIAYFIPEFDYTPFLFMSISL